MNRQQYSQAIVAAALALTASTTFAARGVGGTNPLQGTYDSTENFTYGVCRGVDPSCYHNWSVVHNPTVTIFSRTAAARSPALGDPLAAGNNPAMNATNAAQAGLKRILTAAGITVSVREDMGGFPGLGNSLGALIFLDNTGDMLWDHGRSVNPTFAVSTTTSAFIDSARVSLRQYLRSGGGFVAIHNAVGAESNWYWYQGLLGNAGTYDSAATQTGTVKIQANDSSTTPSAPREPRSPSRTASTPWCPIRPRSSSSHRSTRARWRRRRRCTLAMAAFTRWPGASTTTAVVPSVTTLGQDPRLWADLSLPENQPGGANYFPGAAEFQKLIVNGVKSAMGLVPFCT